jgi:hypothetical protein
MARLFTTGFEWNDLVTTAVTADGTYVNNDAVNITAGVVSSTVRSGAYAFQITRNATAASSASFRSPTFATVLSTTYFFRYYFRLTALPSTVSLWMMRTQQAGGNGVASVRLTTGGKLQLFDEGAGTQIGSNSTATITTNTWYRVEVSVVTNASNLAASCTLRLDGVQVATGNFATPTAVTLGYDLGDYHGLAASNALTLTVDDLALNDSTGAAQNTWAGDGKVVLLLPASDNAKGTGWTNDAATTTNLFDAVNNAPPVGIADTTSGSGLHQIRNATSNANVNYDANLTTYSAAGIGATDTINVLVPEVATAAPVTTSAKQGTYGISANPTISNVALGAGGTSGAFWSGTAAGTYLTGWKWSFGTTTYAPSVTVGSAPVARITQVTSSTRIAMVCAMGMYVDYTPAAAANTGDFFPFMA